MSIRWRRRTFGVYALILVMLTHWPKLQIQAPFPNPDIVAHLIAFGIWTALCVRAEFFGPMLTRQNIAWCAVIGVVYGGVDELTQAIPGLHRTVGVSDWLANVGGVALAAFGASIAAMRQRAPMNEA